MGPAQQQLVPSLLGPKGEAHQFPSLLDPKDVAHHVPSRLGPIASLPLQVRALLQPIGHTLDPQVGAQGQ